MSIKAAYIEVQIPHVWMKNAPSDERGLLSPTIQAISRLYIHTVLAKYSALFLVCQELLRTKVNRGLK